jgi:MFS family permease
LDVGNEKRRFEHPSILAPSNAVGLDAVPSASTEPIPAGKIAQDVWAVSFTSLFSDWSYEMVLGVLPFFLVFSLGATPLIVGMINGLADFAQSGIQNIAAGRWAQGPGRRVRGAYGYLTTTISHGLIALAVVWPEMLVLRVGAWIGRGSRQPIKKAIVSNATAPQTQGIAFGLEQSMDSLGAVLGTASAVGLVLYGGLKEFRTVFALSVIPGAIAVIVFMIFVKDRNARAPSPGVGRPSLRWTALPPWFRLFLVAEAVFGLGYFSILLALLRVGENLLPSLGGSLSEVVVAALVLYLLYNLIFTGMSYPAGHWADRSPDVRLIALSFALFAVVDLLLLGYGGLIAAVLAFVVAGVQVGLQGVTESAWVGRRMPGALAAPAFGWLGTVQGFAILGGTVLAGGLWTYVSAPLAFEVSAVLSIGGAALLLPLLLPGWEPRSSTPTG